MCSMRPQPGPLGERLRHARRQPRRLARHHDIGHPPAQHRAHRHAELADPGLGTGRRSRRGRTAGGDGAAPTARHARPSAGSRGTGRAGCRAAPCRRAASISSHSAGEVEHLAGDEPRPGHVDDRRPGVLGHPVVERDPRQVDHLVDDDRRDDLAPQRVGLDRLGEPLPQRHGEVPRRGRRRAAASSGRSLRTISAAFVFFV